MLDPTPYALPVLLGTPIPKSWIGEKPLLGSKNPLTSVARAVGAPGAKGLIFRRFLSPAVGVAVVGIGFYNVGILVNGAFQAIKE